MNPQSLAVSFIGTVFGMGTTHFWLLPVPRSQHCNRTDSKGTGTAQSFDAPAQHGKFMFAGTDIFQLTELIQLRSGTSVSEPNYK